jgi:hypothetical protein
MAGMSTLQVGDWVRTHTGREGKIVLLWDNGKDAYVDATEAQWGAILTKFHLADLTKIDPPKPDDNPPPAH